MITRNLPAGSRFGNLIVVSFYGVDKHFRSLWTCNCDCGKEVVAIGRCLIDGDKKSCSPACTIRLKHESKFKKLAGTNLGNWRFLGPYEIRYKRGRQEVYCLCVCSCGTEKLVNYEKMLAGKTTHCNRCTSRLQPGICAYNSILGKYKYGAKRRGLSWKLSKEQFDKLTKGNCAYCGCGPSNDCKAKSGNGNFLYNGIDRVDSSLGYVEGNVVSCCTICNYCKSDRSKEEFLSWVRKVAGYELSRD